MEGKKFDGTAPPPPPAQSGAPPPPPPPPVSTGAPGTVSPEEAEAQAALDQLSGLFYSGNPKHAMSGVGEGLKNLATGVSMGLVGLVGATVAGSQEEGTWGGVKGFGTGLVGLAGFTGYGAYAGLRQAGRGLYNTPEAVNHASKGELLWDSNKEQWVKVLLEEDFKELPSTDDDIKAQARKRYNEEESREEEERKRKNQTSGSAAGSGQANPLPPDSASTAATPGAAASVYPGMNANGEVTDYYLFLGCERTATTAEIKKAFMRKAQEMHPDKNLNDPHATARFQQLMQVYNVLSNETTRAEYDRTGRVDASSVQAAETNPIEETLGVGFLEPLVGKLRFAAYFETGTLYDAGMLKELHRRRCLRIARNLCDYLDNTETGFESARVILRDAVSTPTGPQIVMFIAESYHVASRQQLYDSAWKRELDSWCSSKATTLSTSLGLAASGARTTYRAVRGEATEEDMVAVLVAANESDIRRTVLQACRLVLYDASVSADVRKRRAERLEDLSNLAVAEVGKELKTRRAATGAEERGPHPPATGPAPQAQNP